MVESRFRPEQDPPGFRTGLNSDYLNFIDP